METIIIVILTSLLVTLIWSCMNWYNGVLNVVVDDENGDTAKLEILEYDKVRSKRIMLIVINRNNK